MTSAVVLECACVSRRDASCEKCALHSSNSHHAEALVRVFGHSELLLLAHEINEAVELQKLSCVWIVPCTDAVWSVHHLLRLWTVYIRQNPGAPQTFVLPGVIRLPCHRKLTRQERKPARQNRGAHLYPSLHQNLTAQCQHMDCCGGIGAECQASYESCD